MKLMRDSYKLVVEGSVKTDLANGTDVIGGIEHPTRAGGAT